MLTRISVRTPLLLAIAAAGILSWGGSTPALAACSPGAPDKPDLGFVDSNCDGIDGDRGGALFVAPGGSDANPGSYDSPKKSVAVAVTAGIAAGKDVYVAAGTYVGKVAFLGAIGNIGVYGGYDAQSWQRSAANVTTLQAPGQVVGVALPGIVLQLLTVHSTADATTTTSYGVRAFYQGAVALSRVTVEAAPGANGAHGADASQTPPAAAPDGKQGVGNPNCDPNALTGTFNSGAAGGTADGLFSGGAGGDWHKPYPFKGIDGQGEAGIGGGIGGDVGWPGGSGIPGNPGTKGKPGLNDLNTAATLYIPMNGTAGGTGTRGAGGGGGGMGQNTCIPGSGGGAGGRPGVGGEGGKGGGGSIGVFAGAGAHALVIDGSVIHTADGGKGGNGGYGQPGGAGGQGGDPGIDFYENGQWPGTAGGYGGPGGAGGRGGPGAGGASIGVLAIDARAVVAADTQITVGAGGLGGVGSYNGWVGHSLKTIQLTTLAGSLPAMGDFDGDGLDDAADACPIAAGSGNGCPADAPATTGTGGVPTSGSESVPTSGSGTGTGITSSGSTVSGTAAVSVRVLPTSSCLAKGVFTIRIRARRAHLKTGRLVLDGRRLRLVKGPRIWKARVDLRRSTRTRHTLTIRGTLRDGRPYKQARRYRTCAR
jgi:hypothetical protein